MRIKRRLFETRLLAEFNRGRHTGTVEASTQTRIEITTASLVYAKDVLYNLKNDGYLTEDQLTKALNYLIGETVDPAKMQGQINSSFSHQPETQGGSLWGWFFG